MKAAIHGLALSSVGANGPLTTARVGIQTSGGQKSRDSELNRRVQNSNMSAVYTE